jgi:hypothetical protein
MARAGRTEPDSVPIWLKLSEDDAARMAQVLARPEFAGWTRAEWCLEMIQTALRYYTRTRPAAAEPVPEPEAVPELEAVGPEPEAVAEPEAMAPEPEPVAAEPEAAAPEAMQAAIKPAAQPECSHPADARDYQTGTCGACGAILWD